MNPLARWKDGAVPVVDVALAVVIGSVITIGTAALSGSADPIGYLLLATSAAALAVRRLAPIGVLAAIVGLAVVDAALVGPNVAVALPLGVALYTVTDAGGWRVAIGGIAMVGLGSLLAGFVTGRSHVAEMGNAAWIAGWLVASILLGQETRARRQLVREAEQRAIEAQRGHDADSKRRAGEERIAIARELHDILAHRISLINVQAGAGLHLMDRQPEQARIALTAIHGASKEALVELRATLGVLRQVDGRDPLAPSPGLSLLEGVIDDARSAGIAVELSIEGAVRGLPAGVDLAAYRIVQESLTNVVRHARAASTRIGIDYRSKELLIDVQDDGIGDGRPPGSVGSGLLGMRERAAALGGEVQAGPVAGGGFLVHARLPLDGAA